MPGDPWDKEEPASFCDLARASKELDGTASLIMSMSDEVADAKTIKEMHSERLKQSLSKAIVKAGAKSIAQGEVIARCDPKYLGEVDQLEDDLRKAERTLSKYAALHAKMDGLRTLISAQKETIRL